MTKSVSVLLQEAFGTIVYIPCKVHNTKGMLQARPGFDVMGIARVLFMQFIQHREICSLFRERKKESIIDNTETSMKV